MQVESKQTVFNSSRGPTHLIQFGLNQLVTVKDDKDAKDAGAGLFDGHKQVALMIPGNPGIIGFYEYFMGYLHQKLDIPVIGISHVGHIKTTDKSKPGFRCNLKTQIDHHLEFLEKYIPPDVGIIFLGHSIGTFIILQLMSLLSGKRMVSNCFLLFPVIERLNETKGARFYTLAFRFLRRVLLILVLALSCLKIKWQKALIKWHLKGNKTPECVATAALHLFSPQVVNNVITMALDEFEQVKEANNNAISENLDKLYFLYGEEDHWCPVSFYENMKKRFAGGNITLLKNIDHAFVMDIKGTQFIANSIENNLIGRTDTIH